MTVELGGQRQVNGRLWTRAELLLAINLYCRLPFGHIHRRNAQIKRLACVLGRTPGSVAWKLANFAHLDPSLERDGAAHVSQLDRAVWGEFLSDWERLVQESEDLWASVAIDAHAQQIGFPAMPEETASEAIVQARSRTRQDFFREMVCSAYGMRCCITGLEMPCLLVAGHIVPWSEDPRNRLNPRNGLCLNVLHHVAFDQGLITVTEQNRVRVARRLLDVPRSAEQNLLVRYNDSPILMPSRFRPDATFLQYHREHVFLT